MVVEWVDHGLDLCGPRRICQGNFMSQLVMAVLRSHEQTRSSSVIICAHDALFWSSNIGFDSSCWWIRVQLFCCRCLVDTASLTIIEAQCSCELNRIVSRPHNHSCRSVISSRCYEVSSNLCSMEDWFLTWWSLDSRGWCSIVSHIHLTCWNPAHITAYTYTCDRP